MIDSKGWARPYILKFHRSVCRAILSKWGVPWVSWPEEGGACAREGPFMAGKRIACVCCDLVE